jgi:hypothetical protein
VLDIDGNRSAAPLSDGLIVVHWTFELGGKTLEGLAVSPGCTRCNAPAIEAYLTSITGLLDIDGNGQVLPLSDGLLVFRWLDGVRGQALVNGLVMPGSCTRCTATKIEKYLAGLS